MPLPLGPCQLVGVSDATTGYQFNEFLPSTGWDVLFSPSTASGAQGKPPLITGSYPHEIPFEIYQMHLDGPVGSSVLISINRQPWNHVIQGWQNYNDPQQPMLLRNGDEVQFAWNVAFRAGPYTPSGGSNVRPRVTMWMRETAGGAHRAVG